MSGEVMNSAEKLKLKRLFKIAQQLQEKKPWDFFEEIGIFAVTLNNRKTPFYCVFLQETIVACPNKAALKGLFYLSEQDQMPDIQRLRYQQHLALYFDKAEDISSDYFETLMECDVQPQQQKYPFFESAMPGLLPDNLVKQEVQTMIDILKQINDSMEQLDQIKELQHNLDTQIVHRYFDFEQKKWSFNLLDMIEQSLDVQPIPIKKDVIKKISDAKMNDQQWEVDVAYTPMMIDQKKDHRQGVIRVLVIANHQKEEVYFQKLVTLKDDSNRIMVDQVIDQLLKTGLPSKVFVRDDIVLSLFEQLDKHTNISIEKRQKLPTIDRFVEAFVYQSMN